MIRHIIKMKMSLKLCIVIQLCLIKQFYPFTSSSFSLWQCTSNHNNTQWWPKKLMICVLLDFIYLALISDSCNLHSDKRNLHTKSHPFTLGRAGSHHSRHSAAVNGCHVFAHIPSACQLMSSCLFDMQIWRTLKLCKAICKQPPFVLINFDVMKNLTTFGSL